MAKSGGREIGTRISYQIRLKDYFALYKADFLFRSGYKQYD